MQLAILVLVILSLFRGASVVKKVLRNGSPEKQIETIKSKLKTAVELKDEKSAFVIAWFLSLGYGLFLFSLSIFILIKAI